MGWLDNLVGSGNNFKNKTTEELEKMADDAEKRAKAIERIKAARAKISGPKRAFL